VAMKKQQIKKSFVLGVLFFFPLVAYIFFASGVNRFGILPTLTNAVLELPKNKDQLVLKNHITVMGFLGGNLENRQVNMFNLNQKIYKRFSDFNDFQFVMMVPLGTEDQVNDVMKELQTIGEVGGWRFIYSDPKEIAEYFSSLKTPLVLDSDNGLDAVFIIDKDLNLRGRDGKNGEEVIYGYNATSVSELTNTMIDDVKIILAEYRMALKKNNVYNSNE
jgi:hypothetical protein